MKILRRLAALLVVAVMLVGALASCELLPVDPVAVVAAATLEMSGSSYTATVNAEVSTDNELMQDAFSALGNNKTVLTVVGEDFMVQMNVAVGGVRFNKTYTLVDDMLYHNAMAALGEGSVSLKQKAVFDGADRAEVLADVASGASIDALDFGELSAVRTSDGYTVTCSKMNSEAVLELTDILAVGFGGVGTLFDVADVEYVINIKDGRFDTTKLSCTYKVMLAGVTHRLTMSMKGSYEYSDDLKVSAPEDGDAYTEVEYSDIIR